MGGRAICLADANGRPSGARTDLLLDTKLWSDLYRTMMSKSGAPLLRRAWRDQWGSEGDALFGRTELTALRAEIAAVLRDFPAGPAADFFTRLDDVAVEAERQGMGVLFYAD